MSAGQGHLAAVEEIKQLKARYFRELDTKNWEGLNEVFTADAVFDLRAVDSVPHPLSREPSPPLGGEGRIFRGRAAIVAMIRAAVEGLITVHHGHTPEIEILSQSTARGIVPMEDTLWYPSGELLLNGFGHYHETYEKDDGRWQIKASRLTRLFVAGVPLSIPGSP
jgi:SnoaL-like protein